MFRGEGKGRTVSLREALLILHILGAFLIVAGAGTSTVLGIAGGRTISTRQLGMAASLQLAAERFVIVPGALLAIVFGSWLVGEGGHDFGAAWVSASYVLWVIALGLGTGVLVPHARRVRDAAARLVAEGVEESDALRAEFDTPRARGVGMLLNVIILVFLYLMVARPGA